MNKKVYQTPATLVIDIQPKPFMLEGGSTQIVNVYGEKVSSDKALSRGSRNDDWDDWDE